MGAHRPVLGGREALGLRVAGHRGQQPPLAAALWAVAPWIGVRKDTALRAAHNGIQNYTG